MGKVNISKGTKFTVAIDSNVVYTISDVYSDVIIVSWQNGAKNQKYQSGDVLSFFETGEWIAINN